MTAVDRSRAGWRKSSFSGSNGNCIEVGNTGRRITIRDTKNQGRGPALEFTPGAWRQAIKDIKTGDILQ